MKYELYEGTIRKCTQYKVVKNEKEENPNAKRFQYIETGHATYIEGARLVRVAPGLYVVEENFNSLLAPLKLRLHCKEFGYCIDDFLMPTFPYGENTLFVDEDTLIRTI